MFHFQLRSLLGKAFLYFIYAMNVLCLTVYVSKYCFDFVNNKCKAIKTF